MKHLKFFYFYLITAFTIATTSCSSSEEAEQIIYNSKPSIEIEGFVNGTKFRPGENINTNINFSDDVELSSYKIVIQSSMKDSWKEEISGKISGKKNQLEKAIKIPSSAKLGKYQVLISAKNSAGNETSKSLEIEIAKASSLSISISEINDGSQFKAGNDIKATLKFQSDTELKSWKINIIPQDNKKAWKKEIVGNISGSKANFSEVIHIEENAEAGRYKFIVSIVDELGNKSSKSINLEFIDINGFNGNGFDKDGYDRNGYDRNGFGRDGFNKSGFNRDGYNRLGYDKNGYDRAGFNKAGFNKEGFNKEGFNRDGYDRLGYDKNGYDRDGYDKSGLDRDGYDKNGYDKDGFNKEGFNRDGYDRLGYDKNGYDRDGYDKSGLDRDGYDKNGYDSNGYDRDGYNRKGYDRDGISREWKDRIEGILE